MYLNHPILFLFETEVVVLQINFRTAPLLAQLPLPAHQPEDLPGNVVVLGVVGHLHRAAHAISQRIPTRILLPKKRGKFDGNFKPWRVQYGERPPLFALVPQVEHHAVVQGGERVGAGGKNTFFPSKIGGIFLLHTCCPRVLLS